MIRDWRKVWREGIAPQMETTGLHELKVALGLDLDELIQGSAILEETGQDPLAPITGCNPVVYPFWLCGHCATIDQGWARFTEVSFQADQNLATLGCMATFLKFWDENERSLAFSELQSEVEEILRHR